MYNFTFPNVFFYYYFLIPSTLTLKISQLMISHIIYCTFKKQTVTELHKTYFNILIFFCVNAFSAENTCF